VIDGEIVYTADDADAVWVDSREESRSTPDAGVSFLRRRLGREDQSDRRLAANLYISRELTIIYAAKNGMSAMDERVLREMRDFELTLRNLAEWQDMCHVRVTGHNKDMLCDPGVSFGSFAWASEVNSTTPPNRFEVKFDAKGSEMLALPAVLAYLKEAFQSGDETRNLFRFFPKSYVPPSESGSSLGSPLPEAIRTTYVFHLTIGTAGMSKAKTQVAFGEAKDDYKEFVQGAVYPLLVAAEEKYHYTNIYYSGDDLTGYEINLTLMQDLMFAIGSMVFVTVYLWIHTQSIFLSIASFLIIFCSVPVAYVLTPASKTTIASFLSVFLMTGIGCDVVFVFVDFWNQSISFERVDRRLTWMLIHAGKSCLATSATTAVSFFANLASCLQPLREFGMFMGLCVMSAYVLVLLLLPPLIVISNEKKKERVKHRIVDISVGQVDTLAVSGSSKLSPHRLAVVGGRGGEGKRKQETKSYMALFNLASWVAECPCMILIVTCISTLIFAIGSGTGAKLATGMPEIFPSEHNQVAGLEMAGKFASVSPLKSPSAVSQGTVCNAFDMEAGDCFLQWCYASVMPDSVDNSQGQCWYGPTTHKPDGEVRETIGWGTDGCKTVNLKSRVASSAYPSSSDWRIVEQDLVNSLTRPTSGQSATTGSMTKIETLTFENWETGGVTISPFYQAPDITVSAPFSDQEAGPVTTNLICTGLPKLCPKGGYVAQDPQRNCSYRPCPALASCEIPTLCFFGTQRCELPGWQSLAQFNLSQPWRLLAASPSLADSKPEGRWDSEPEGRWDPMPGGRWLQATPAGEEQVSRKSRIDVTVLWGIRAPHSTPLVGAPLEDWSYDPTFDPSNPWSQRAFDAMCRDLPANLKVTESKCWMASFSTWMRTSSQYRQFPSRNFDEDLISWYRANTLPGQTYLWMVDRKMKACYFAFYVNVATTVGSQEGLEYMQKWEDYVSMRNSEAPMTANRAFHTTSAWVRAEAEVAIISSTLDTIIISGVCAFLGVLIFTQDLVLAFYVLFLVIGIICGLAFFMIAIMGWDIGPIEVISLVVFVGYSLTYSLHIAHDYNEVLAEDPELLKVQMMARRRRRKGHVLEEAAEEGEEGQDVEMSHKVSEEDEGPLTDAEVREGRVRLSILHIGGATFSSAASTIGSSVFLLFCTLNIFGKLGAVVITVTLLSIFFALVPLPAGLLIFGPGPDSCWKRCIRGMKSCAVQAFTKGMTLFNKPKEDSQEPLMYGAVLS